MQHGPAARRSAATAPNVSATTKEDAETAREHTQSETERERACEGAREASGLVGKSRDLTEVLRVRARARARDN